MSITNDDRNFELRNHKPQSTKNFTEEEIWDHLGGEVGNRETRELNSGDWKGVYSGIKSEFIKRRMEYTQWEDHEYIDDLRTLSRLIDRKELSFITGMLYTKLRIMYPTDFLELCREHSEKRFKYELSQIKRKRKLATEIKKDHKKRELKKMRNWLSNGGTL